MALLRSETVPDVPDCKCQAWAGWWLLHCVLLNCHQCEMNKDVLALAVVLISWAISWVFCLFKPFPPSIAQTGSVSLLKSPPAFYSLHVPPFFSPCSMASCLDFQMMLLNVVLPQRSSKPLLFLWMTSENLSHTVPCELCSLWKKPALQPIHKSKSLGFPHQ